MRKLSSVSRRSAPPAPRLPCAAKPTYFPIAEYGRQRGNPSLDVLVSSPTYTVESRPPIPYLDVTATHDSERRTAYLNVLNRSEKMDITARADNVEDRIEANAGVWEMNHPDLKATRTFGADQQVLPVTRTVSLQVANNGLSCTFPRHSLTILRLQLN